jgi:hypothetical protein
MTDLLLNAGETMVRLPTDGGDSGVWDDLLNEFLLVEHNNDGSLKSVARPGQLVGLYTKPGGGIPYADLDANVQTALDSNTLSRVFIDVKSKGAKGDGTTNDSAAIQAAITESVTSGVPVYLSPGTYKINAALAISTPVTIIGAGRGKAILKAANGLNDYIIKFSGGATGVGIVGARFADFTVDGNKGQQTSGGGILADGAVQCSFERIHFTSCYNWGLKLGPVTGAGTGHHNMVYRCLFDAGDTSGGIGGGVWVTTSDENWLLACDFEFLGGATNPGSETAPAAVWQADGLAFIQNCNFVQGGHNCRGVVARDSSRGRIHGCMFDGVTGHNIFIVGDAWTITGNTFTDIGNTAATVAAVGVYLEFGANLNVVANNSLVTSATASKTASLIKDVADGGGGGNIIVNNSLAQVAAPTVGMVDIAGTGTTVSGNTGIPSFIPNTTGTPATVAGGGTLYVEAGALKFKGSGGTVTTLGAA